MDVTEDVCEGVDWILLAQDLVQITGSSEHGMNLQVS
jgi:hypothetical protein